MKTRVAAAAALAVLPLIGLTVAGSGAPASAARVKAPRVSVSVLPQIAQMGATPASAGAARGVVEIKVTPRPKAGTPLTVLAGVGSKYAKAGVARTDSTGVARLNTPLMRSGQPLSFKASLARKGAKPVLSPAASSARWAKTFFSEEFNGTTLPSTFEHRMQSYNPEGLRNCSKTGEEATVVGGGVATISVLPDPTRSDKCAAYKRSELQGHYAYRLNGHISTEHTFSFKYGVAAARLKFPKAQGQHGGFWLQTTQGPGTGAEIDVIEWFGQNKSGGVSSFTYHPLANGSMVKTGSWLPNPKVGLANKSDAYWKNYHVYSVEWTPKEYIFRIDGKESWRSRVGISHVPEFIILSMLSSDYEIPLGGDQFIKQSMQADWVRVWQ